MLGARGSRSSTAGAGAAHQSMRLSTRFMVYARSHSSLVAGLPQCVPCAPPGHFSRHSLRRTLAACPAHGDVWAGSTFKTRVVE